MLCTLYSKNRVCMQVCKSRYACWFCMPRGTRECWLCLHQCVCCSLELTKVGVSELFSSRPSHSYDTYILVCLCVSAMPCVSTNDFRTIVVGSASSHSYTATSRKISTLTCSSMRSSVLFRTSHKDVFFYFSSCHETNNFCCIVTIGKGTLDRYESDVYHSLLFCKSPTAFPNCAIALH